MLRHSKSGIFVKGISLFQPHNDYTDTEEGWQMEMSYMQADQALVFIVWMESHIEVWGVVRRGNTLCHAKSTKVDIMVISLFQPHNAYTDTEKLW